MKSRGGTTFIVVVAMVYLALVAARAVSLKQTAGTLGLVVGVSVMMLPVIAAYFVWREIQFGNGAQEMGAMLDAHVGDPRSSEMRATQSHVTDRYGAEASDDWVSWFRAAVVHEDQGDRRRARAAMRHAWRLYRDRPVSV